LIIDYYFPSPTQAPAWVGPA